MSWLTAERHRNRLYYALLIGATILLGLASRRVDRFLPGPLHKNTGDVLWAMMAYWIIATLFARRSTLFLVSVTGAFCLFIECFKFIQAPWLDTLRATTLGRLIFGYNFSWSNLLCYAIGIGIGALIERLTSKSGAPVATH
ncbi:MAG TPA: DUF2809 domain-containing protein [Chthonomonadaceae bacterium]|nr:DUF2809 domain-containing protein [Chthonomonadaceae bacterium]